MDAEPPADLRELQALFARAIRTPLRLGLPGAPTDPSGYDPRLLARIEVRGGLDAAERIAVYNRQYWYRLFSVMQEELPLLRGLLGAAELNRLADRYLTANPPSSFSLGRITDALPEFLADDHVWNRPILRQAATLDRLHIRAFDAASRDPLIAAGLPEKERRALPLRPLVFQPYIGLFEEDWNLVGMRREALRDPDAESPLEPRRARRAWVIHRFRDIVHEKEVPAAAMGILRRLSSGLPLAEAVAGDADSEVATHVSEWFAEWSSLGWFVGGLRS